MNDHRSMLLKIVDHSLDTILQVEDMEIDEQTESSFAQLHGGEQLCFVKGMQVGSDLECHNHHLFDEQIDSVTDAN